MSRHSICRRYHASFGSPFGRLPFSFLFLLCGRFGGLAVAGTVGRVEPQVGQTDPVGEREREDPLVREVVNHEHGRAAGQRIVPLCPFVRGYAQKRKEETSDVIQW